MTFAGISLSSFGDCKVTKWGNSVYTDFERKEITYRGQVIASVEVPTVRHITADIRAKASTTANMDTMLANISTWLYGNGVNKLIAIRDTAHYYKARCTTISTPERSGNTARFTVSFTCDDYRLFNVSDNQPTTSATANMSNFTFAGRHCLNDVGCVFVMDSFDAIPAPKLNKYEISGISGTLRYDTGEGTLFEERNLSGTLYFVKSTDNGLMTEQEITNKLLSVSSWLVNSGRASLVLDSDTTRSYQAEIADAQTFSRKDWENGNVKLKFVLQPFSSAVTAKTATSTLSLSANNATDLNLATAVTEAGGIGRVTPLTLTITNTGSSSISDLKVQYYNELDVLKTMRLHGNSFALARNETIAIDGLSGTITKGATDGVGWLESGDFPVLSVNGTKKIKFISSTTTTVNVTVSFNARWI